LGMWRERGGFRLETANQGRWGWGSRQFIGETQQPRPSSQLSEEWRLLILIVIVILIKTDRMSYSWLLRGAGWKPGTNGWGRNGLGSGRANASKLFSKLVKRRKGEVVASW